MGSPLSPILSNLYMELIEYYFILPHPLLTNCTWLRYVDDIFAAIPNASDPKTILNHINNIHQNITFTLETPLPTKNSLPFLDTLIMWDSSTKPLYTIFRKPTASPNYIHWYSAHTINTKIATLSSLYLRALKICSPALLKTETDFLRNTFNKLQYPTHIINTSFKKARTKFYSIKTKEPTLDKSFLPIPHINLHHIKNIIPKNITLIPSNNIILKKVFKPPKASNPNPPCIYSIPCQTCELNYIGETTEHNRRIYQHRYDLNTDNQNSALTMHRHNNNHNINLKDNYIIKHINNYNKRKMSEAYCIKNLPNYNLRPGDFKIDQLQNAIMHRSPFFKSLCNKSLNNNQLPH